MGADNTDHQWVIHTLVTAMIKTRESILELSKNLHGPIERCPLRISIDGVEDGHMSLSKTLTGLDKWIWHCPFCGQEFQD